MHGCLQEIELRMLHAQKLSPPTPQAKAERGVNYLHGTKARAEEVSTSEKEENKAGC